MEINVETIDTREKLLKEAQTSRDALHCAYVVCKIVCTNLNSNEKVKRVIVTESFCI